MVSGAVTTFVEQFALQTIFVQYASRPIPAYTLHTLSPSRLSTLYMSTIHVFTKHFGDRQQVKIFIIMCCVAYETTLVLVAIYQNRIGL